MKTIRFILIGTLILAGIAGCQKENITVEDDNLLTEQETIADAILTDLDALTDEALNRTLLKSAAAFEGDFLGTCPSITTDRTLKPRVMTLDFGTGCTGKDGKVRSGKIIITSESLENASMKRVKTFDNFYVEGRKVEGSIEKTITLNREDLSRVAVVKEDITITFPDDKGSVMRKSEMTREYQMNTIGNLRDDVITSKGTVITTRTNGVKVTKTISDSDPLVFKVACHQFVSGVITMTSSDGRSWSIDYGDGECDKKAEVNSGDRTKEITLR